MMETPLVSIYPFLYKFNSIFYTFANEMMEPDWCSQVPTAAVQFNDTNPSKPVRFIINPDFWKPLGSSEKLLVFIHEVLHVLFNHGARGNRFLETLPENQRSHTLLNIAQDICINEIILEQYLKDVPRFLIPIVKDLCLIESVFAEHKDSVERGKSFEYYYMKFMELYPDRMSDPGMQSLDRHDFMHNNIPQELVEEIVARADNQKSTEITEENFSDNTERQSHGIGGAASNGKIVEKIKLTPEQLLHRKLDIAIATASGKHKKSRHYAWYGDNRRTSTIIESSGLMLPTVKEKAKHKHRIVVYADVSGSCEHLSKKFLSMVAALPEEEYQVDFYVFASYVAEAKVAGKKISYSYTGFGTDINRVLHHYNKEVQQRNPDGVLVLTDGEYSTISHLDDKEYERWHFFIVDNGYKNAPKKSKIYTI
jgi:predicted metal-dependent peptidase